MALALAGCGSAAPVPLDPDASDAAPVDEIDPTLRTASQICKLLSDRNVSDPTANDVQHRANILGADLGIPVVSSDRLFILFGDTIGRTGIWPPAESHPDAVGYGLDPASAIAADPRLLCSRRGIVTLPASDSRGPELDAAIAADFAGVAMIAPPGHSLAEFIHNPAGPVGGTFAHLPGDFEVPSGAFSLDGAIYAFYMTVVDRGNVDMIGSYLARWQAPTTAGPFAFQILYRVDSRVDPASALGGRFINVAAEVDGDHLYVFGTGEYRRSSIHVARKPLAALDTEGGFEPLGEIVATPGYGEISVRYFASIDRWMLLAEELTPASNRIVAAFAREPAGPWSEPLVVHDMADPSFRATYCCGSEDQCDGAQMFNCNRTGFYGTYLFPTLRETADAFTVTYTMSSFSPYNVALFEATFAK